MIGFSAVRALSIYHLSNAQNSVDKDGAAEEIQRAIDLDPSEPMFRLARGQQLYFAGNYDEAASELRFAIERGLATSPVYFNLLAAEMLGERKAAARQVFDEALRVYPRSVFLRTAYAAFLKRDGDVSGAEREFERARATNATQARSWQLAHDEGLERLALARHGDPSLLPVNELIPDGGPLALVNFQQALRP